MKPVWGFDEAVAALVAGICGFHRGFGPCKAMGFVDCRNELVGGIVFHNWQPEAGVIELSAGSLSRLWPTREILKAATSYAFGDCGCHAMVMRTDKANPSRSIWRKLGATEHVLPHMRGPDIPEYVNILTRDAFAASKYAR